MKLDVFEILIKTETRGFCLREYLFCILGRNFLYFFPHIVRYLVQRLPMLCRHIFFNRHRLRHPAVVSVCNNCEWFHKLRLLFEQRQQPGRNVLIMNRHAHFDLLLKNDRHRTTLQLGTFDPRQPKTPPSNIRVEGITIPSALSCHLRLAFVTASSSSDCEYVLVAGYFASASLKMARGSGTAAFENHSINQMYPPAIKIIPSNRIFFISQLSMRPGSEPPVSLVGRIAPRGPQNQMTASRSPLF